MKTAKFQYKCRLCGETYSNPCISEEVALMVLVCTISGTSMPKTWGTQPEMLDIHAGCKTGKGIADLIGYVVED